MAHKGGSCGPTPSSNTRGGQIPVHQGKQYNTRSATPGGQAKTTHSYEGKRGPEDWLSRGCVSPLGGVTAPNSDHDFKQSERRERRERPQGPLPKGMDPL